MAKKELGIVSALLIIAVFIFVGVMLVNSAEEQSNVNSSEATKLTISFGNAFIFAGVFGVLFLILIGLITLAKIFKII